MRLLLILWVWVLLAASGWARGGGGCVEEGTLIDTPQGQRRIEQLQPGDAVWTVIENHLTPATVQATSIVTPAEYLEIHVGENVLRVTEEHPVATGSGIFRTAQSLQKGEGISLWNDGVKSTALTSILRVKAARPAYNLLVSPGGVYIANGIVLHNKGCFLPETPILLADGREIPISEIKPGDELLAFTTDEKIVHTVVRQIITHDVEEYAIVHTEGTVLRVTLEHPFYAGNGTFQTLQHLGVGDSIFVLGENGLRQEKITSIEMIRAPTRVYNLQTDHPNTYFANGVAVHNKGGGCFPAGTSISTAKGSQLIENITPGSKVLSVDPHGNVTETIVESIQATRSPLVIFETDHGTLRTTSEHPVMTADGSFLEAGNLSAGKSLRAFSKNQLQQAAILRVTTSSTEEIVYNLSVGTPHTFIADGFVVHNKGGGGGFGGGGFGGGYHGGYGGSSSNNNDLSDTWVAPIFVCLIILWIAFNAYQNFQSAADENLDYLYGRSQIGHKAQKTRKLLDFLARTDQEMSSEKLQKVSNDTFLKLQECWQAREYAPMQPLLMPDLYKTHCAQLAGMKRSHEINRIEGLKIEYLDIINVRYTDKINQREFTALITAKARDYYVDDRTFVFQRGDASPARFQEFWTFHRMNDAWLLREIEQTKESSALTEENFFEQFTDVTLDQIYGDTAGQQGPAGPASPPPVLQKTTRVERLLNFLVQTDKVWNREAMIERARQVFIHLMMTWESGEISYLPAEEVFPDVRESVMQRLALMSQQGEGVEYRNLCIRKVELILVRNFDDNTKDEYTVRISAHAQRISYRRGDVIAQDEDVTPFVEYWTFGRMDILWKLKEVLPEAKGSAAIDEENVDEGSSKDQLQWYYQQKRAL